jgi:hypothetical protein
VVPVVVGREPEQAQLRAALDAMQTSRGGLVLLGGEAGVGKTTLTDWLTATAEDTGTVVVSGGCYDLTATPPYGPWVEIMRTWPGGEGMPDAPEALRDAAGLARVQSQTALFEIVLEFLTMASAVRPLLVVLEDLHWIDQASLDLLRFLARQFDDLRLLVVATYRSDELHRRHPLFAAIPALAHDAGALRIELQRLADDAILTLIRTRYALADPDALRLATFIYARAEGHGLYTRELLLALEEADVLAQAGSEWTLGDLSGTHMPGFVRQVIEERLTRLGDDAYRALTVAAVAGQQVALDLWSELADLDEEALLDLVDRAVEARVLLAAHDGLSVSFAHALIREALYDAMTPPRRRILHRRIADALLARPRPDPDAVAWHLQQASDSRAADWLIRAGERAQRSYAWPLAAERFIAALPSLEADPARDGERARLLYRIGRLLRFTDHPQAIRYLEDAAGLADSSGQPRLAAHARFARGQVAGLIAQRGALGEMEAAINAWEATATDGSVAVDDIDLWPDPTRNPDVGTLVEWLSFYGRFNDAVDRAEPFLAGAAIDDPMRSLVIVPEADARHGLGMAYAALGRIDDARDMMRIAQDEYDRLGHLRISLGCRDHELQWIVIPYLSDRTGERDRLVAEVRAWTERIDPVSPVALTGGSEGDVAIRFLEGAWDESWPVPPPDSWWFYLFIPALSERAWRQGDSERAWSLIRRVFPRDPRRHADDVYFTDSAVIRVAAAIAIDEQRDDARDWLELHDALLRRSDGVLWTADGQLLWAEYFRSVGDRAAARTRAVTARSRASEPRQPLALLRIHRFLGQLALEDGRADESAQQLAASRELAEACRFPFELALTLLVEAELHAASGDPETAHALLDAARTVCEPLGARPTLERIAELEARLT